MYSRTKRSKGIKKRTKRSRTKRSSTKRSSTKTKRSSTKRTKTKRSRTRRSSTRTRKMRGGNMWPLIGAPYNAAQLHPSGNHYAFNTKVEAWPEQSNAILENSSMVRAGGGRKGKGKKQRGGSFGSFINTIVPDDILTLGRTIPAAAGHAYDRFTGVLSSPSSLVYPTQQPLVSTVSTETAMRPPDIMKMYNNNNNLVSKI
jgi:hypothetical protein